MYISNQEQRVVNSFSSKQWNERPHIVAVFMVTGLIGWAICLLMMIFIPGLRNFGATVLFSSTCAIVLTPLLIAAQLSAENAFLRSILTSVNGTILDLTGSRNDELSVARFKALIGKHEGLPLLVNGVPGLDLWIIPGNPSLTGEEKAIPTHRDRITAEQYWALIKNGTGLGVMKVRAGPYLVEHGRLLSLLFSAIPGRVLRAMFGDSATSEAYGTKTTSIIVTVTAPDYGVTRFDNLLAAVK
jgi:hypothetical protein